MYSISIFAEKLKFSHLMKTRNDKYIQINMTLALPCTHIHAQIIVFHISNESNKKKCDIVEHIRFKLIATTYGIDIISRYKIKTNTTTRRIKKNTFNLKILTKNSQFHIICVFVFNNNCLIFGFFFVFCFIN